LAQLALPALAAKLPSEQLVQAEAAAAAYWPAAQLVGGNGVGGFCGFPL
jgi:hypothetical protein